MKFKIFTPDGFQAQITVSINPETGELSIHSPQESANFTMELDQFSILSSYLAAKLSSFLQKK